MYLSTYTRYLKCVPGVEHLTLASVVIKQLPRYLHERHSRKIIVTQMGSTVILLHVGYY